MSAEGHARSATSEEVERGRGAVAGRDPLVAIVGAGPHGLATALHLVTARPDLRDRLAVVDPAGRWLANWRETFARLDLGRLRSAVVHHPGPDPGGLDRFARDLGLPRGPAPYGVPPIETFDAYCDELIRAAGLDNAVVAARVARATIRRDEVVLETTGGDLVAQAVVVATRPHMRVLPNWVGAVVPLPVGTVCHSDDVDLRGVDVDGETVAVIGGGQTAVHLAISASRRGATVHLVTRRRLVARNFDVEAGWLGPKELVGYRAEPDPARRLAMAVAARGGGSVAPEVLAALTESGVVLHEANPVRRAGRQDSRAKLELEDGSCIVADRLWLATGAAPSISACRVLRDLAADLPVCDDLPVTTDDLRLGPWPVWVTGRLASLALGPAAGNLWGAREAARRISEALTGVLPTAGRRH